MLACLRPSMKNVTSTRGTPAGTSAYAIYTHKSPTGDISYFYTMKKDGILIPWFRNYSAGPTTRYVNKKNVTISLADGQHVHTQSSGINMKCLKKLPI